eukprot:3416830-Pyramimonas_sp.AAC.1
MTSPDGRDVRVVKWDRDRLMKGLRGGSPREGFIRAVEAKLENDWPEIEATTPDPDKVFQKLDEVLREYGATHFQRGNLPGSRRSQLASQRLALLARRRELRERLGSGIDVVTFTLCCTELHEITKQAKALFRADRRRKQEQLVEEIWEAWRVRDFAA